MANKWLCFLLILNGIYCVEYILLESINPSLLHYKEQMKVSLSFPGGTVIMVFFLFTLFVFFFFFCKEEKAPMETYQGDVRSVQRMSIAERRQNVVHSFR